MRAVLAAVVLTLLAVATPQLAFAQKGSAASETTRDGQVSLFLFILPGEFEVDQPYELGAPIGSGTMRYDEASNTALMVIEIDGQRTEGIGELVGNTFVVSWGGKRVIHYTVRDAQTLLGRSSDDGGVIERWRLIL